VEGLYGEFNMADWMQIRGGKFKIPYGLDQTSGETNSISSTDRLAATTSRRRDIGGEVHGRFFKRG
jgi:hypothetical protein